MDEPAIRIESPVEDLRRRKRALDEVSFDVPRGQIFGLLGPNGAGKSTLINILAGLVIKTGGQGDIWGFDIDEHPRNAKRSIGVVPQEIIFDPFFTPRETLEIQAGLYGIRQASGRATELLAAMHLTDKANAYSRTLSGGMKRRLLVAKAMVHSPPILVLDEPTAGVDVELRRQLWDYVRQLNAQGVTIVLTTHYLEEAEELCDRIAIIHHGRVIANEPTRELVSKAQEKAVVVTFDRDIAEVPTTPCFENIALIDERTLEITYRKDQVNAGQVLASLTADGLSHRRCVDPRSRPRGCVPQPDRRRPGSRVNTTADVLIVGSGAAGLTAALNLAETHKVAVIAKGSLGEGATSWAQGGIAAVLEEGDSFEAHVNDTMIAGAGLNDLKVVEHVVEAAPRAIEHLIELGVPFAQEGDALHLTREGGHSHRRIVHVADATGYAVQQALEAAAAKHPNITLGPRHGRDRPRHRPACDAFLDQRRGPRPLRLQPQEEAGRDADRQGDDPRHAAARAAPTSIRPRLAGRPATASRWRGGRAAGSPTWSSCSSTRPASTISQVKNFLITEAVRGEGGQLKLPPGVKGGGTRFMPRFDERAELAPRDIVARAIDHEIKRLGLDYVHLDISHRDAGFRPRAFPQHLREAARPRHRHHQGADPGRPGAALHLRRRGGGPQRLHRRAGALCRRRSHPVRASRRQPPGLQQPARMPRVRRSGGEAYRGQLRRPPTSARDPRAGTKAGSPTATRRS